MGWFKEKYGEDAHPKMSAKLYNELCDLWHNDFESVDQVLCNIQDGIQTEEDVWKAINRPDIPPEKWRDFEDGWRPEGWN